MNLYLKVCFWDTGTKAKYLHIVGVAAKTFMARGMMITMTWHECKISQEYLSFLFRFQSSMVEQTEA